MPTENWSAHAGPEPGSSGSQANTLLMRHTYTCFRIQIIGAYTCFTSNFTINVIFRIIRSKAKIFKFDVNLSFIKRDDFSAHTWTIVRSIRNMLEKSKFMLCSLLTVTAYFCQICSSFTSLTLCFFTIRFVFYLFLGCAAEPFYFAFS